MISCHLHSKGINSESKTDFVSQVRILRFLIKTSKEMISTTILDGKFLIQQYTKTSQNVKACL